MTETKPKRTRRRRSTKAKKASPLTTITGTLVRTCRLLLDGKEYRHGDEVTTTAPAPESLTGVVVWADPDAVAAEARAALEAATKNEEE